ncbi:DUF421 domain-containing protein [Bacillus timonensis]|nr:DUF421 domain-containing protein [Bacillus timonensis]
MPEWIEVIVRSVSIILGLFVITKLLGKKQLSKLSFFEYIVGITIGDIAGTLSMDIGLNIRNGVTSILVWSLFPVVISFFSLRNKAFRDFVEGKATVFIKDGKIMEDNMKKEKFTVDELLAQLRKKNIFQFNDVEFAALEPCGELSVFLKKEKQPVRLEDIMTNVPSMKEPQTVVMDGLILDEPLSTIGLNRGWLKEEVEKKGILLENIFLAQVDSYGQLTVDLYDDKIELPPPMANKLMLASLKKIEADLELFALATDSMAAKDMYMKNAEKVRGIYAKVRNLLDN